MWEYKIGKKYANQLVHPYYAAQENISDLTELSSALQR